MNPSAGGDALQLQWSLERISRGRVSLEGYTTSSALPAAAPPRQSGPGSAGRARGHGRGNGDEGERVDVIFLKPWAIPETYMRFSHIKSSIYLLTACPPWSRGQGGPSGLEDSPAQPSRENRQRAEPRKRD